MSDFNIILKESVPILVIRNNSYVVNNRPNGKTIEFRMNTY